MLQANFKSILAGTAVVALTGFLGACQNAPSMAGATANSNIKTYQVQLNGAQEVPAKAIAGTGTAEIIVDTSAKTVKWTLTYAGLTGPATMAHIHGPSGAAGTNAPVMVPFAGAGMTSPNAGQAPLTDVQMAAILAGTTYVNVHTAANPAGEIRGQITPK